MSTPFLFRAQTYLLDGALMEVIVGKAEADGWLMDHTPLYYMGVGGCVQPALDFSVSRPHARSTDRFCLKELFGRNLANFTLAELDEFDEQQIKVFPVVYFAYGLSHRDATKLLTFFACAAAQRHRLFSVQDIIRQTYGFFGMLASNKLMKLYYTELLWKDRDYSSL